ncbi:non-ribosomal peptide synthetase, partial [Gordonia paraffinivorans]
MSELIKTSTSTRTASNAALVCGERRVSYEEFAARVADLARGLIAAGVGPEVPVGVEIDRSVELLVAVHAVVAAGGHYVPLDPNLPEDRVRYMVATSGAQLILVAGDAGAAQARYEGLAPVRTVDCSGPVPDAAPVTDADRLGPILGETAAYTIFTSGSTGRPKGVTVSHRAVANRLAWMRDWYDLTADDVFVQKTPTTFDVSVWELFLPATIGATLVIAAPGRHGDPAYIAELIAAESVTVVHFVPSMLAAFTDVLGAQVSGLSCLRLMFTSGEALTAAVAGPVLEMLPTIEVHNLYGPTEAAVDVTAQRVIAGDRDVPIGVPVPGTQTYVLDAALNPVPAGVPGELYLGGVQVARGYAARPDLTAERFVADPFGDPGARLYRTGDLVRWNRDGFIEYLGRTDFQVKLRGQRLELGEVESAIASAPGVVHAAASVVEGPGGQLLVGYVAPDDVDLDAVAAHVAGSLPEYMRPSVWVVLEEMPLNSAGKVDRRSLPDPELGVAEYVAPETPAEETVAKLFADLLGVERVSVVESFFDLGGNSLAAMRLVARVSDALGVQVSVRDVFDAPSVRELVVAVSGRRPALPPVRAVSPRPGRVPLSFAQQRMWFINRLDSSSGMYNIPLVLRVVGDLDVDALRAAVVDVVVRHEVLRTTFPDVDGVPFQLVHPAGEVAERLDWVVVDSVGGIEGAVAAGFVLQEQWPVRVRVWGSAPGEYVVAVVMHHIAADGESLGPFVSDLVAGY